jgi:hypothetical protein
LDGLRDAIYLLDRQWRFLRINKRAGELWNRDATGLVGKVIWEAFPRAVGSEPYAAHQLALKEQRPVVLVTTSPVLNALLQVNIRPVSEGLSVSFRPIDAPPQRRRVLVAEDDFEVREMLTELLESAGYLVTPAPDLSRAEYAIEQLPLDGALLDESLPGGRGSTLARRGLQHGIVPVLMTGYPTPVAEAGPCLLRKPIGESDITRSFDILLEPLERARENRILSQHYRLIAAEIDNPQDRESRLATAASLETIARETEKHAQAQMAGWVAKLTSGR